MAPLHVFLTLFSLWSCLPFAFPYAETGKWDLNLNVSDNVIRPFAKSMFNGTTVSLQLSCDAKATNLKVAWVLRRTGCADEYISLLTESEDQMVKMSRNYLEQPTIILQNPQRANGKPAYCQVEWKKYETDILCDGNPVVVSVDDQNPRVHRGQNLCPTETPLKTMTTTTTTAKAPTSGASRKRREAPQPDDTKKPNKLGPPKPAKQVAMKTKLEDKYVVAEAWEDGVYLFVVGVTTDPPNASAQVHMKLEMKASYGYLSAADYPKRPFFGIMCLVYVIYGIAWLVALSCQWRDLLQIQFWIGGVIILGMLEKAVFYAEYETINSTGISVPGAVLFAEIVSCAKRTLARMLVIIVSLGFGIVKPRLGPLLHRILLLGGVYFVLGSIEAGLRNVRHSADQNQQLLLAEIPLAVIDAGICWWVFTSLVQTMRTLRLRRNTTKLNLFRHLANVIVFAVLASVAFMIWSIRSHKIVDCLTDWKELWVDDVFWHALFSILLAVIMVLWRPTANNQRYAFSALLDDAEDGDPDEEEPMMTEAYEGMKLRSHVNGDPVKDVKSADDKMEEDLKWVEENIPTSVADAALPSLLDSDEEIMTTKFEMSKME